MESIYIQTYNRYIAKLSGELIEFDISLIDLKKKIPLCQEVTEINKQPLIVPTFDYVVINNRNRIITFEYFNQ